MSKNRDKIINNKSKFYYNIIKLKQKINQIGVI